MNVRQNNFADASSAIILVCLVVLSLIANTFFKQETPATAETEIRFPAYETENQDVNKAMPFVLNITLPDGWEVRTEGSTDEYPILNLYNPYFLYVGDRQIGHISFNVFTPPAEEVENVTYHQYVWPILDKGQLVINEYMIVRLTDKFEAGYCNLSDLETVADAVLCYNKDINNMVAIVLEKGYADVDTLQQICLSLSFTAM